MNLKGGAGILIGDGEACLGSRNHSLQMSGSRRTEEERGIEGKRGEGKGREGGRGRVREEERGREGGVKRG